MTTQANSQLGMRSFTLLFCTVFCEQLEFVSEGFASFYLTEQNKDVCEQKLEEQAGQRCLRTKASRASLPESYGAKPHTFRGSTA